ncbi:unnamed protein product, partial [Choristocarpus tenellus]
MMRALEHFTRVLFQPGDDDLCVQFLYADLSSPNGLSRSGGGDYPAFGRCISEEELNRLLCGER